MGGSLSPPVIGMAVMKRVAIILTTIAMVGALVALFSGNARADSGQVAAGILGGLAAGTILGAATAPRPYYAPAPVYVEPAPVYVEPHCYWAPGEPIWDGWRQAWVRSRVQVCD
jgi:tetrahydromethanopterin S-methyltransferase subunit F